MTAELAASLAAGSPTPLSIRDASSDAVQSSAREQGNDSGNESDGGDRAAGFLSSLTVRIATAAAQSKLRAQDVSSGGGSAARAPWSAPSLVVLLTSERALDTALWQLLASVAVPGCTIHFVVELAHNALLSLHLGDAALAPAAVTTAFAAAASALHAAPNDVRLAPSLCMCRLKPKLVRLSL